MYNIQISLITVAFKILFWIIYLFKWQCSIVVVAVVVMVVVVVEVVAVVVQMWARVCHNQDSFAFAK